MRLFSFFKSINARLNRLKKHGVSIALSLSVVGVMLLNALDVMPLRFIDRLENFAYDMRLNLLMPRTIDERIVIVDLDEGSLKEQGRWPWPRDKMAKMMDQLFDHYQINTLGFDVVFAETDESSGLKNLEWMQQEYLKDNTQFAEVLKKVKPKLDYDQIFADSFKNRNVVLGYYFQTSGSSVRVGTLPPEVFSEDSFPSQTVDIMEGSGYGANLDVLQKSALSAGHFNPDPDVDGITRKVSVLIKYGDSYYEALSTAVVRAYFQNAVMQAEFADYGAEENFSGLEAFRIAGRRIPVDGKISMIVPYRGVQGSFRYVPASDVLTGKAPISSLKDKIVLLGTTAPGLMDLRATPVQSNYAGVEVHANLISGILDNNIKERPAYTKGAEFLLLLIAGLLLTFKLPKFGPLKATLLTFTVLAVMLGINFSSWQYANLVLPIASMLFMVGMIYLLNMSYGFFIESRGKRQLTGLFGQYVPPELVDEMAQNPDAISLKGENREMTVLFSDIRGFTTISEGMNPEQLTLLMNEFLTPLTQVIHSNRGTIDKYMGDAIMAFWGAPLKDKNHAQHALKAGLAMVQALKPLNIKFAEKGWPAIKIGVGLNTGNMTVGNMGSSFRMAYTVMGDAVNLGSRIESLTKNYGVDIMVSEFTKAQVPDMIYRELDTVRVKGKDKPVTIFEPLGLAEELSQASLDELNLYHEALQSYRNQDWKAAETQMKALAKTEPHTLYALYIARIEQFKKSPPDKNWDGVYTYETK